MKTLIRLIPVLILVLVSLYPLFRGTQISPGIIEAKEEKSSLPRSAKDVIVLVCDFSSFSGDALDKEGLGIVSEIHMAVRDMEGIRSYSSLLNTPVVKTYEDEILVLPFISPDMLSHYDQNEIAILRSQYDEFPEIWPYISRDFLQCTFYLEPGRSYPAVRLIDNIEKLKKEIETKYPLALDFTGLRPVRLFIERLLTIDILKMLPVLFLLVSLVYVIGFWDIKILLISWFTKIVATTSAYGCYLFFFKEISPLVIIIPVFNAGLLSDYLIQMFYNAQNKGSRDPFVTARQYLLVPLSLAALTSITGFLSLLVFKSSSHLLLGFTISGSILLTYLLTILWIPSISKIGFLSLVPGRRISKSRAGVSAKFLLRKIRRGLIILFLSLFKKRIFLAVIILVLLVISLFNLPRLTIQPYPLKHLPPKSTVIKAESMLNEKFSGTIPFMLQIDSGSTGAFLLRDNLLKFEKFHQILETDKEVGFQYSILTIIKKINFYFNNSDPDYLSIPGITDDSGFGAMIEQYLLFFSTSTSPEEYESLVDPDYRTASISGILKYAGSESLTRFLSVFKKIQENLPSGWSINLYGSLKELVNQSENLKNNWFLSFAVGSLLIFLTVFIFFRNIKMSFLSLLPSFLIILFVTGLAPVFGIRIDEYTIIFVSIATGLTVEYTILILNAIRSMKSKGEKRNIVGYAFDIVKSGGVPVFLSFLTTISAFTILLLSSFSGAVHLAAMLSVGICCALFSGVFILPIFFAPRNTGR